MALLKIYTYDSTPARDVEKIILVEDAEDVVVHQTKYECPPISGSSDGPSSIDTTWGPEPFIRLEHIRFWGSYACPVKVIDYTKNGERYRGLVRSLAYICNRDGKTIQTVTIQ